MTCKQANYNKNFKSKFILRLLAIILVTGMSTVAFTASTGNSNNQRASGLSYFDPFELETVYLGIAANEMITTAPGNLGAAVPLTSALGANLENNIITRPPIRVPYRPPLRSPFQPFVPGPPSWYPGPPPWLP